MTKHAISDVAKQLVNNVTQKQIIITQLLLFTDGRGSLMSRDSLGTLLLVLLSDMAYK